MLKRIEGLNKIVILFTLLFFIIIFVILLNFFKFGVNISYSLPQKLFLINLRSNLDKLKINDFIAFSNVKTKFYKGQNFIKLIAGVPGDKIIIEKFDVVKDNIQAKIIINDYIFFVKEKTEKGTKINVLDLKSDYLPDNKYFVYSPHENSYDSRYEEFGLIDRGYIIGTVIPIF